MPGPGPLAGTLAPRERAALLHQALGLISLVPSPPPRAQSLATLAVVLAGLYLPADMIEATIEEVRMPIDLRESSIVQAAIAEGRAQGVAEGRAQGVAEGRSEAWAIAIRARFGPGPGVEAAATRLASLENPDGAEALFAAASSVEDLLESPSV